MCGRLYECVSLCRARSCWGPARTSALTRRYSMRGLLLMLRLTRFSNTDGSFQHVICICVSTLVAIARFRQFAWLGVTLRGQTLCLALQAIMTSLFARAGQTMSLKEAEAGKQLDTSQDFVVGREDSASKAAGHLKGLELVDDKPGMLWQRLFPQLAELPTGFALQLACDACNAGCMSTPCLSCCRCT